MKSVREKYVYVRHQPIESYFELVMVQTFYQDQAW